MGDSKKVKLQLERWKRHARKPKIVSAVKQLMEWRKPPAKVLDIGARDGFSTFFLKKKGYDALGTDVDPEALKFAKKKKRKVIQDDIMKTKLKPDSFDIIYGRHVVEHCEPTSRFFSQCEKLLKKDGILYLIFPLEPKREKGRHRVFFETKQYFAQIIKDINFETLYLDYSIRRNIVCFSPITPEALYVGKVKK